jgi:retinol-binding protein 3
MVRRAFFSLVVLGVTTTSSLAAQDRAPALNADGRAAVLDEITSALTRMYVFPDVAAKMSADLRARAARGEFDAQSDAQSFAEVLTERLQAVSRDKHLRVRAGPLGPPRGPASRPPAARHLFGRAERLDGDVAYVEILSFGFPPHAVREETEKVMSAAADAKALIVDLRANGGGSPHTVALVTSYLFGETPVYLNSLYFRPANRTDDFYTDPSVPGGKFGPDKPVFVLTSGRTFSGAEEFAYNLQTRKRATIVGETTGGGAHPGEGVSLPHGLHMFVPTGRAINPVTKTNWEGVGVKPDVAVSAEEALETAHRLARVAVGARKARGP